MKPVIITVIGKDRPGLVDAVAKKVYQHGGNWQASSFAHMAGQFAGFVEVLVPAEQHHALIEALNKLDGLQVHSQSVTETTAHPDEMLRIEVMGNDRTGIVQEITNVLNGFNLNILHFASTCESAPNWGSQMFKAQLRVGVSTDLDRDDLQEALEAVANDLVVDITTTLS
ncbi:glycine cleavage system protein R [Aestuariibacter sp. GS-14]|uniref:glycine cleavage system protein R n=1 Tax=Aestuariibacter sp. GS-14 TaxID=2590670 RepID=UPI00112AA09A|nr:ACT domain-containing protein [Aestuariibacter sp. GS-14]TPV52744.1 glycine cleavage system protein R [Aestuariibacter sp. GS-14]